MQVVVNKPVFDFEAKSNYTLTLVVMDEHMGKARITLHVQVNGLVSFTVPLCTYICIFVRLAPVRTCSF